MLRSPFNAINHDGQRDGSKLGEASMSDDEIRTILAMPSSVSVEPMLGQNRHAPTIDLPHESCAHAP